MKDASGSFYRMLFDESPVSVWVEDFSGVYEYVEKLRLAGVTDLRAYFLTYPQRLQECVANLRVVDVNNTTLRLYKAESKQELLQGLPNIFKGEAVDCLMESILALSEGRNHFEGQGVNYDLKGNKLFFRINWSIPGTQKADIENVIVVLQDISRLEAMRKELEESEVLFRCIFEQASEGMVLLDAGGRVMLVNAAFSRLLGIPVQDIPGRYICEVYQDFCSKNTIKTPPLVNCDYMKQLLANAPAENIISEYSFVDAKHKLHSHKQTILPIHTDDQNLYAIIETDLSAGYRTELITALLHRISHAVNTDISLDDLFSIIHDSLGTLIDVSNFYIALYDEKSKIITFPYLVDEIEEDTSPVDVDSDQSLTAQIISEAKTLLLDEAEVLRRTEQYNMPFAPSKNYLGVPLVLAGKVIGALVVQSYTDPEMYNQEDQVLLESISEQIAFALHKKQSDQELAVLIQAIEQAGEGIMIFSPEGFIHYVNAVFEKATGYGRDELIDKPFEYLPFDQKNQIELQQTWLRVRSSQPWRGKIDLIRKDGARITLDMVVKPVIDTEGRLSSIVASCKDVTYEILREEQLKRTQRLEAIGRLTGGIAHDFNNVLSAIIGYTELAADDLDPESDCSQKLLEVLKSANRAKEMISHLISFSRQEESKTEIIELVDHVKESVRFLKSYLPKNIKIREDYPDYPSTMVAVPGQVHQIVINLGTNAMHAIHAEQGLLEVAVDKISFHSKDMLAFPELNQSEYLRLTVKDNGHGIEENLIEHIFDPYFTTKRANEGTGLGLSIVHSIVQAHRGAIRVESRVGVGTAFTVYLPLYTPDKWYPGKVEENEFAEISGTETVMFVDDEPMLVNVFRQGLMKLGYRVEGFTDPRKAEEYFTRNPQNVDIVITDTTMPYMNGIDLSAKLLAINPALPVVICTGFTTLISAEEARERGIRDFIMKPIKIRDIAGLIRDILDGEQRREDASRLTPE
jgi:PAS domain S-box-containing protein